MSTALRLIAVHVEEPNKGAFEWVLDEQVNNAWSEFDRSVSPVVTYKQAMADGLLALQGIVVDLDIGPRVSAHATGAEGDMNQEPLSGEPAPTEAIPPRKPSFFGFGPVR